MLSSAGTADWQISVGFLRPALICAEKYGFDPTEAGRGGGVILIEISDQTSDGTVIYRYTDFDIIAAIAEGFLIESTYTGPGRRATPAREDANNVIKLLRSSFRKGKVPIPKKLFVTVGNSYDLLGLMGRRSEAGYGMFATRNAYKIVTIDADGRSAPTAPQDEIRALDYHMKLLCDAQPKGPQETKTVMFEQFKWTR